jgi:hypothetical protein
MGAFGLDHTGVDGVDANLLWPKFLRKHGGNGINRPLGCGVDRTGGDVELRKGGPDVDDASAVVAEELDSLAGNEKSAEDVGVEKTATKLDVNLFNRRELADPGVVYEYIELAEFLLCLVEEAIYISFFGYVSLNCHGFASRAGDLGDDLVRAFLAGGIVDDDGGALLR